MWWSSGNWPNYFGPAKRAGNCQRCVQSAFCKRSGVYVSKGWPWCQKIYFHSKLVLKARKVGCCTTSWNLYWERERNCCWSWMTPLKANCGAGERFGYVCICIQGILEDREDNSELWIYIVHLALLHRKKIFRGCWNSKFISRGLIDFSVIQT